MSVQIERQTPLYHQESAWDYPRPPRVEPTDKHIRVIFNGVVIAESRRAKRGLETSHPPTYYIPQEDIRMDMLAPTQRQSYSEFKGAASYWTITVGDHVSSNAAWIYANPQTGYESIRDYLAFYASRVDAVYVDDERVQPQAGDFYGGWITSNIVDPFKGALGTRGW
jgi:uncharacterized protein (DUF427 family)